MSRYAQGFLAPHAMSEASEARWTFGWLVWETLKEARDPPIEMNN